MLVGGRWSEAKILRAARAFETSGIYDSSLREGVESAR
jgi:hypothetical protein